MTIGDWAHSPIAARRARAERANDVAPLDS
jgi:hypothetical protein